MSIVTFLPSVFAVALMVVLLAILIKRKLYKHFPVFFSYAIWTLCATVLRLAVSNHPLAFFLTYWLTEAVYLVLAFFVMVAILGPFAGPFSHWHPRSRIILPLTMAFLIGVSLWTALFKPMTPAIDARFASGIYIFVALMCILEIALFAGALVIRRRNPFEWSQHEFGMLVGFGMLALLMFIGRFPSLLALFHIRVGPKLEDLFRYFPSGAFIGSAIVWLIAFWRPEPPDTRKPRDIREYEETLRWLHEQIDYVKKVMRRYKPDFKFLPVRPRSD